MRKTIAESQFPFSDEIRVLRAALAKLEPGSEPKPRKIAPPLPGGGRWSSAGGRRGDKSILSRLGQRQSQPGCGCLVLSPDPRGSTT